MLRAEELITLVCIRCPRTCHLEVSLDSKGGVTDVAGYCCAQGKEYAIEESTDPRRTLSSLVYVEGFFEPLSVKTEKAVPKKLINEVADEIRQAKIEGPVRQGEVLIENICGTGINVIATKGLGSCD